MLSGIIKKEGIMLMRGALRIFLLVSFVLLLALFGFAEGADIAVGERPRAVAVGDFNRDGWDDFVVANELSNDITVCLAQKDGTFDCSADRAKFDSYKPVIPTGIAVADITKDGKEDLVLVACGLTEVVKTTKSGATEKTEISYYNVFTLKGDGKGEFKIDKKYLAGNCPSAVALADLDRDGTLELVVVNSGSNNITVIDGSKKKDFDVGTAPVGVTVGDFDRDGDLDAAVVNSGSDNFSICIGTGDTKYFESCEATVPTGPRPLGIAAGDFNCDNILDLAVANSSSDDVWTYRGDGAGGFTKDKEYRVDQAPSALVVADLNRDCKADIAVTNALANDVWVLFGRPEGAFEATAGKFAVGSKPVALAVGDFDKERDCYPDLVVANELSNTVTILLGSEAGAFFRPRPTVVENQPPVAKFSWSPEAPKEGETVRFDGSASHDPDGTVTAWAWDLGDGTTDEGKIVEHVYTKADDYTVCLTVTDDKGAQDEECKKLTVAAVEEEEVPPPPPSKKPIVEQQPNALANGDFDGDGKEDLAVANMGSNTVSILIGAGEGKFTVKESLSVGKSPRAVVAADLDRDGKLDLAVANAASNDVTILLGNGQGNFLAKGSYAVGSNPVALRAIDLDGDGDLDLVTANSGANNASALLNNGDGSFAAALATPQVGNSPEDLALADLDGDNKPDLVVVNLNSDDVAVLLGNGDGTFKEPTKLTGFHHPRAVALHDLDGDGKPDLAVADTDANSVVVLLGKGDGTFAEERSTSVVGASPRALAVADLNHDGKPDLAVADYTSDTVSVLLGKGDGTFAERKAFSVGKGPSAIVVGRFNEDAHPDLATTNTDSNDVSVLLGQGDGNFTDPGAAVGMGGSSVLIGGLGSLVLLPLAYRAWELLGGRKFLARLRP